MKDIIFWSGIFTSKKSLSRFTNAEFMKPQVQRPIGTYQLSHWLRKNKISCQVIEFIQLLTSQELIELTEPLINEKTIAIGLSTVFWPGDGSVPESIAAAMEYLKDKYPKLKFIAGGGRVTRPEYLSLKFDKLFLNESEDELLAWCYEQKFNVKLPTMKFDITTLEHRFIEDDIILEDESLPIELGRGCIFKCKFCNYANIGKKKHTYQRNFDLIIDEIKYNKDTFGTDKYIFLDDTCNEDLDKVKNFSTFSKRLGFDINWVGYLRADLIWSYPETVEMLKDSGLISVFFGLESLHPTASRIIGKGWCGKFAKDWIPKLYSEMWNKEISIFSNFILGLPGEPRSSFYETLEWCKSNDIGQFNFYPLVLKTHWEEESTKSEFDKNYSKYGYTVNDTGDWINGDLSYQECAKIAQQFNVSLFNTNRMSGFSTLNYLNMGFKVDEIKSMTLPESNRAMAQNIFKFKDRYVNQFKKHFNL